MQRPEPARIRDVGLRVDLGDEPETAAVDRADHPLVAPVVADRLADLLDAGRQRRFGDESVAPHPVQQLLLGHDPCALLDEGDENGEDLRLDGDLTAVAEQLLGVSVQHRCAEPVPHRRSVSLLLRAP